MTSKFLNISTDTTLGGSSASDNTVASQKAVKAYADTKQAKITSSNKLSASLVSGLATVATSGSYNDLSNKPTVDQTYSATSTKAQSGVAVANAIATKQDTLVSGTNIKTINGNSVLGSGNITIETSSTPNVDGETISYNASDALQAIAVKNVRDGSTLPIWHGTEYQWNHGDPTTWYYWQTSVTALWTSGGSLPSSTNWQALTYGDGVFIIIAYNGTTAYSNDNGQTWFNGGSLPPGIQGAFVFANGKFIVITGSTAYYSSDKGQTWVKGGSLTTGTWKCLAYGNGRLVATSNMGTINYSTDEGLTWNNSTISSSEPWESLAYGDGRFIAIYPKTAGLTVAYSTDDGETWDINTVSTSIIFTSSSAAISFGNGRFVVVSGTKGTAYSTDGGETWQKGGSLPNNSTSYKIFSSFADGKFVELIANTNYSSYSTDGGETWAVSNLPSSAAWWGISYGNNNFITITNSSTYSAIFSVTYDKCYTDTANPTTTSVVYSAPETQSALTISSVTSGAITLSNNNTYYYNQSGNQYTYDTIGNSHPEYLCFIDGVGVKMGNTMIATNTPITTTITSSSTDTEAPSAKAVYDALNP